MIFPVDFVPLLSKLIMSVFTLLHFCHFCSSFVDVIVRAF